MSKERLLKYANSSKQNKKRCFALGSWCNRQNNVFGMQEVFDCLDDYSNTMNELSNLIDELTTKSKVNGRSSVVFGNDSVGMYIYRCDDGTLEVRRHRGVFTPNKIGQHQTHNDDVIRKDGQMKKNVINSRETI